MCKGKFYRNLVELQDVDPGSLWVRDGDVMTLVDEDEFVEELWVEEFFEVVMS